MWVDAQRDGRLSEYRWRCLRKFRNSILVPRRKVWLTPAAGVPCSNAANTGERKTWTSSEYCTGQNSVRGSRAPEKCIYTLCLKKRPTYFTTCYNFYTHSSIETIYGINVAEKAGNQNLFYSPTTPN